MSGIQLIVNADDFGFTGDTNEGIAEAHTSGILTATTLMANGDAFDHAVALSRQLPTLDIGCHLALVQGRSVRNPAKQLPATVLQLVRAIVSGELEIYDELAAQLRKLLNAGIQPTHLDTHKHTHLLPPVLKAVVRLARDFNIPWIRQPFDFQRGGRVSARAIRLAKPYFARQLAHQKSTDHFTGFHLTGTLDTVTLAATLEALPEGLTELMCHPGKPGPEIMRAATRLKESRAIELRALTSPEAREVIGRRGIQLVNYKQARAGF